MPSTTSTQTTVPDVQETLLKLLVDTPTQLTLGMINRVWRGYSLAYRAGSAFRGGLQAVGQTPADVVWRKGRTRLLRYRSPGIRHPVPLLVVPSLINRYYILDLLPERSLIAHLVASGFDVYLLDWGAPTSADADLTLDDHIKHYLAAAVNFINAQPTTHNSKLTLIGYCMGGTLATIFTALNPAPVANLVNLAGPIGFRDDGIFSLLTRADWFDADRLVSIYGNAPAALLMLTFQMIRPTSHLARGLYTLQHVGDSDNVRSYAAIQQWIFDQVDFPGAAFRQYVKLLYQQDLLVDDQLWIGGELVRLGRIDVPLLNITSKQDETAPWESVAVLNDKVSSSDKTLLMLRGPHIGMVAGRGAVKHFWPQLVDWLAARSGAAAHSGSAA